MLLYFDDERLLSLLEKFVAKSWKFGTFRLESPRTNEGVANYVTSYINSYVVMPRYFVDKQVMPKCTHSLFLGKSANKAIRDFIYKDDNFTFERIQLDTTFGTRDYLPTSYYTNLLFPKCYNYGSQTFENHVYLYKIYKYLVDDFGDLNCAQLAKLVLLYPNKYHRFLSLLDLEQLPLYHHSYVINDGLFISLRPFKELSDDFITWYNRLYSAIRVSKHVLTWCLEDVLKYYTFVDDRYSYDEYLNITISNFVGYVRNFYRDRDFYLLSLQYQHQDQFLKKYPDVPLDLFFPVGVLDYNDLFTNSPIITSSWVITIDFIIGELVNKSL